MIARERREWRQREETVNNRFIAATRKSPFRLYVIHNKHSLTRANAQFIINCNICVDAFGVHMRKEQQLLPLWLWLVVLVTLRDGPLRAESLSISSVFILFIDRENCQTKIDHHRRMAHTSENISSEIHDQKREMHFAMRYNGSRPTTKPSLLLRLHHLGTFITRPAFMQIINFNR